MPEAMATYQAEAVDEFPGRPSSCCFDSKKELNENIVKFRGICIF